MTSNTRALAAVAAVAISASMACTTPARQAPRTAPPGIPPRSAGASAVSNHPWRPVHKGGVSLSNGVARGTTTTSSWNTTRCRSC